MKTKKVFLGILLGLTLLLMLLPGMTLPAAAAESEVSYIERSWDSNSGKVTENQKTCSSYTTVTGSEGAMEWNEGWYVVPSDGVTITGRITVSGTVNLILTDGATLTASKGITTTGATLNIYGQSEGTGKMTATSNTSTGIGGLGNSGDGGGDGGTVNIHGGTVIAESINEGNQGSLGAGIGGGNFGGNGGTVIIYGGTVNATGGGGGAGIGGGTFSDNFGGGCGGTVTIYGGTVNATGNFGGAGIGGGGDGGNGGTVTINGGTVTAIGGGYTSDYSGAHYGAGIGGGDSGNGGTVTINGGTVTANGGGSGAEGIGSGNGLSNNAGSLTLAGGLYLYGDATDGSIFVAEGTGVAYTGARYRYMAVKNTSVGETPSGVTYIDHTVDSDNTLVENSKTVASYTMLTTSSTNWTEEWYVVPSDGVTIAGRITVTGTVNLILTDGAELNAATGITTTGATLNIYAQSAGNGKLTATSKTSTGIGGLGNSDNSGNGGGNGGTVNIHGGTVIATSINEGNLGSLGAGIGGGNGGGSGGTVTIYGGTVNANGGGGGAGIGGGTVSDYIGGSGGTVTVYGGTVNATGNFGGAGIGGGVGGGNGGTVTINGGEVKATGGFSERYYGAGIGGGDGGSGGAVAINGGTVTANGGGSGAVGIGSGNGNEINGPLTLGSGMHLYGGENENQITYITPSGGDYIRKRYMKVNNVPHVHSFTYSATGAAITATCTEDCPDHYTSGVTLTIVKPTLTTYGGTGDASATLTGSDGFKSATGKTIAATDIKYVGRDGTSYGESATAPANAGKYTANITLTGVKTSEGDDRSVTASVDYEIAKADPTVTAPSATATFGQTLGEVALTNPEGNTAGEWAWVDAGTTSIGTVGDHTFKANFTPTDTGNYNSKSNVDVTVTVGKAANPATVTSTASVTKGGNTVNLANNVTKNGATGAVSYAISGEANGCSLSDSILTSGGNTGSVTVNVTVAADDNYNALAATPITVTISDKGTQTITASDVTATYGDTDKCVSAATDGNGTISYAVKDGSTDYIDVDATTGALTIKKVGTATVIVTATETSTYSQATKEVTVTIYKANAVAATVTANNRTYDGTDKPLVTVTGEATGGEMQYALGSDATTGPEDNLYTTSIPTKTDVGTYYIWYKVIGDLNHSDTEARSVVVRISQKPVPPVSDPVKDVINMINNLPDPVTEADAEAVKAARNAYDKLTEAQKKDFRLTEEVMKKLTDAEAAIEAEKQKAADQAAAEEVVILINALPAADQIKADDKKAVEDARTAYDKLTDDQKKLVDAAVVKKLEDAEAAIDAEKQKAADRTAAKGFEDLIAGLPADAGKWTREQLKTALAAYNKLTNVQKALVDPAAIAKLQTAEFSFASSEARAKKVKLKSVKAKKGRKARVRWNRNTGAAGYQLVYSKSRKFTKKTTKKVTIKSNKTVKKTVGKLKKGKTYYFRVRPYTKVYNEVTKSSVTVYGKWSKVKKCKAKK